ncbi:MaoC/PaaZ C-terminal domain-containing protein [Microtetraspora sp. NBRC 16547]|uniref:MaoC/PaaZ C-terminal domain-containing protein n=1 Tax=Microtetraspora sp. NBRC 16547 TaxID=3030993 RepID=UPI0024A1EE25|nr:MaoC/PaaZ C-terminal domain-containing protein [Microtetraspora sp. NBRC 16547]GLW99203.1 3-alpha,7-alpha,12-alpha-trihydroxy-5-beta-cholest-24-enoyl-CoA hydratase [Microtetraspora sp. NBRC 16547]
MSAGTAEVSEQNAGSWAGRDLGERTVAYDERDVILYALAVGAAATDLDLVFEERLRVLPTFALTQAQWAPDALGSLGAFDITTAVHGSQRLLARAPLPASGELTMRARVADVWDKGSAAVFDVEVESEYFLATWSLFAPGRGGFGGERGPSRPKPRETPAGHELEIRTSPNQTALYRLLGDRHHMHIDPEAAKAAGMPRPFMHGLCTLAAVTLPLAAAVGAHPADLVELEGRFAAPVFPGDRLDARGWTGGEDGTAVHFEVTADGRTAISGGRARFRATE